MEHHPIVVIGAGLGGLTAARTLQVHDLDVVVFELEEDRHARVQGGMLDIHDYNGQRAIRAANLWETFTALINPGAEAMRVVDHRGTVRREEADQGDLSRPEVDRGELRDLLIDSLADGTIQWGKKVTAARPAADGQGRHEVTFSDGETITTSLLIGADGAWSKVRPLVSEERPAYVGVSFVETDLFDADARHPNEAEVVGAGMLFAFRGQTGILAHRETDGSLHCYIGLRVAEDWVDTIDFSDTPRAKEAVLQSLAGWDESLRALVADADAPLVPRRINALPIGHSWEHAPGVTLLGDAAHVMSPFAGEGANLAMYDASLLVLAVAAHPGDTEAALIAYEAELFPRAADAAAGSASNLDTLFNEDSPQTIVDMFAAFDAEQEDRAQERP